MSTVLNSQGQTSRSIALGTEGFMPPEQATGRPTYSSDLYSLGLTIIYLLTGKHPQNLDYERETGKIQWRNHCSGITEKFCQLLDRAINPNPHERFPTALAMLTALEAEETASIEPMPTLIVTGVPQTSSLPVTQIFPPTVALKTGEWKKAVITGSLIGGSILASTLLIQKTLQEKAPVVQDTEPQPSTVVSPAPTPTPQPIASPIAPAAPPSPQVTSPIVIQVPAPQPSPQVVIPSTVTTNATIVGEPGSKNIRSGPGLEYNRRHIAYPGDRVQVLNRTLNADNYPWYEIYFPKSRARGWIAGHLLAVDGQKAIQSQPSKSIRPATNATITGTSGTKNLRSGPGTQYSILTSFPTGEKVKILNRGQDSGGYLWYKVYHPSSGTQGWIAAHLVKID
jgi:serine/threonine-protein kinase